MDRPEEPEWYGQRNRPAIERWSDSPPTEDEFTLLIDDLGCSDCVYDYFFWLAPHLLTVIENCDNQELRDSMLFSYGFRFIQAIEQPSKNESLANLITESIPRVKKLTMNAIQASSRGRHLHFATLAACYGEPDMAIYFARYG